MALGLIAALPFVLESVGGFHAGLANYAAHAATGSGADSASGGVGLAGDSGVVGCKSDADAGRDSVELLFSTRAVVQIAAASAIHVDSFGAADNCFRRAAPAYRHGRSRLRVAGDLAVRLKEHPSETLPLMLREATPAWVALLGLGFDCGSRYVQLQCVHLIGGVNVQLEWLQAAAGCRNCRAARMKAVIRWSVVVFAAGALLMALRVQSVQALWFFTSDLVFVLLFPQLVYAIFDSKSNRIGSMVAFFLSLGLRLGGGEPLLGLKPFIHYPEIFSLHFSREAGGLVRSCDRRDVIPVQDASRRGGICGAAAGIAFDGALESRHGCWRIWRKRKRWGRRAKNRMTR